MSWVHPVGGDDRTIHAVRWGRGWPERVFLHGGGQNARVWDAVVQSSPHAAVAVDLPGHGASSWRDDHGYFPWQLAGDLASWFDALTAAGRPRPVTLIGASLGGLAAAELAARRNDRVGALVLIDITPGVSGRGARAATQSLRAERVFTSLEEAVGHLRRLTPRRATHLLRQDAEHAFVRRDDGLWYPRDDPDRPWRDAVVDFSRCWDALRAVHAPVTIVHGEASSVLGPADLTEARRRLAGLAVVTVASAGHNVHLDRPEEFAGLLEVLANPPPDGMPTRWPTSPQPTI